MSNASTWHPLAKSAFSVSGSSGLYDRARPSYPDEAIATISKLLPDTGAHVVELGTGTGIFTRCLLSDSSPALPNVSRYTATEPAQGMREGFSKSVQPPSTVQVDLACVEGTFDQIPVPDGQADLLVAAQAYHWIGRDPNFQDVCIKEAARSVRPGGYFALIWNLEDRDAANWVAQLRDIYEKHEAETPQYRLGLWRTLFDSPSFRASFDLLPIGSPATSVDAAPTLTVNRVLPTTLQGVKDRVLSKSYITALSHKDQEEIVTMVEDVWNRGDGLKWIDQEKGIAEYPYATHLYVMRRK